MRMIKACQLARVCLPRRTLSHALRQKRRVFLSFCARAVGFAARAVHGGGVGHELENVSRKNFVRFGQFDADLCSV